MKAPVIGITTYRTANRAGYNQICLNEAYVSAVSMAGGIPLLLPLGLSEGQLEESLEHIDGVLFSGGGDIQPERYGSQAHPLVNNVDEDRDRVEIQLFSNIFKNEKPFFGICRGLQVINVALGGTLYEDILDQQPGSLRHQSPEDWPRDRAAHPVRIAQGSRLEAILGQDEVQVNSQHHQGIRQLARDLKASAFAPDGIIEAFEIPASPFGIAVQWHPEWMQAQESMRLLFRSFIEAAWNNR